MLRALVNQPVMVLLEETAFHVFGFELLFSLGFLRDYVFSYLILVGHPLGIHLRSSYKAAGIVLRNRKLPYFGSGLCLFNTDDIK